MIIFIFEFYSMQQLHEFYKLATTKNDQDLILHGQKIFAEQNLNEITDLAINNAEARYKRLLYLEPHSMTDTDFFEWVKVLKTGWEDQNQAFSWEESLLSHLYQYHKSYDEKILNNNLSALFSHWMESHPEMAIKWYREYIKKYRAGNDFFLKDFFLAAATIVNSYQAKERKEIQQQEEKHQAIQREAIQKKLDTLNSALAAEDVNSIVSLLFFALDDMDLLVALLVYLLEREKNNIVATVNDIMQSGIFEELLAANITYLDKNNNNDMQHVRDSLSLFPCTEPLIAKAKETIIVVKHNNQNIVKVNLLGNIITSNELPQNSVEKELAAAPKRKFSPKAVSLTKLLELFGLKMLLFLFSEKITYESFIQENENFNNLKHIINQLNLQELSRLIALLNNDAKKRLVIFLSGEKIQELIDKKDWNIMLLAPYNAYIKNQFILTLDANPDIANSLSWIQLRTCFKMFLLVSVPAWKVLVSKLVAEVLKNTELAYDVPCNMFYLSIVGPEVTKLCNEFKEYVESTILSANNLSHNDYINLKVYWLELNRKVSALKKLVGDALDETFFPDDVYELAKYVIQASLNFNKENFSTFITEFIPILQDPSDPEDKDGIFARTCEEIFFSNDCPEVIEHFFQNISWQQKIYTDKDFLNKVLHSNNNSLIKHVLERIFGTVVNSLDLLDHDSVVEQIKTLCMQMRPPLTSLAKFKAIYALAFSEHEYKTVLDALLENNWPIEKSDMLQIIETKNNFLQFLLAAHGTQDLEGNTILHYAFNIEASEYNEISYACLSLTLKNNKGETAIDKYLADGGNPSDDFIKNALQYASLSNNLDAHDIMSSQNLYILSKNTWEDPALANYLSKPSRQELAEQKQQQEYKLKNDTAIRWFKAVLREAIGEYSRTHNSYMLFGKNNKLKTYEESINTLINSNEVCPEKIYDMYILIIVELKETANVHKTSLANLIEQEFLNLGDKEIENRLKKNYNNFKDQNSANLSDEFELYCKNKKLSPGQKTRRQEFMAMQSYSKHLYSETHENSIANNTTKV